MIQLSTVFRPSPRGVLVVIAVCVLSTFAMGQSVSSLGKKLQRAAKKDDLEAFKETLLALGNTDDAKAAQVILRSLGLVPVNKVVDEAIQALASLGSEKVAPAFEKLLSKKRTDDMVLTIVVEVASEFDDEVSEGWLIQCLERGSGIVARNTIPVLVKRRSKAAIPLLIDRLEKVSMAPSTESYQVRDALVALTGYDFETVVDWRKFWEARGADLDPKNLEKEFEGPTGLERKLPGGYEPPEFFGVKILSNRVIFVVDVSGSMMLWDGDDESKWKERQRIIRVKNQLTEVLKKLPKQATFNIISYSDHAKAFVKQAVPANPKTKKKALEWVAAMKPNGPTHTDDALLRAFQERDVDTIVLLTDGAPAKYDAKPKDLIPQILEDVRRMNRLTKVTIHTFGFPGEGKLPPGLKPGAGGKSDDDLDPEDFVKFLKDLAEENGGKFTPIS